MHPCPPYSKIGHNRETRTLMHCRETGVRRSHASCSNWRYAEKLVHIMRNNARKTEKSPSINSNCLRKDLVKRAQSGGQVVRQSGGQVVRW
jgi:hypothetical protein